MTTHSSMGNILLIDDDHAIVELLRVNLSGEGYSVFVHDYGTGCLKTAMRNINLVIVDASHHSTHIVELIRHIREATSEANIGIIHCANFDSESTIIEALDAGADDCIRKPFSLRELIARVRAIMRRRGRVEASEPRSPIVHIGCMTVNSRTQHVSIDGKQVALSTTEFAILQLLLQNINTYTSRVEIYNAVWPESTGANLRIVDTNISRLRHKLGCMAAAITNRPGLGYMIAERRHEI